MATLKNGCSISKLSYSKWRFCRFFSSQSGEPLVSSEKYQKVTLIRLNRPDKKNAVNLELLNELSKAFQDFEDDSSSNVGVLHGEGGNFCAGYDLNELASKELSEKLLSNKLTERYLKKPIIAAINGYAVGFGFDLALWCDARVMENEAITGFYGRRFGIPIPEWSIKRLVSYIGLTRSLDLIFTGRGVNALEAQKLGLINNITECGTVVGQALSWAICVAKFPQPSLLADRAKVYDIAFDPGQHLLDAIKLELEKNTKIALQDVNKGAKMYLNGIGRHGKFTTKIES